MKWQFPFSLVLLCIFNSAFANEETCNHSTGHSYDKIGWRRVVESAEFSGRDVSRPIQFAGYLWLSNGYRDSQTVARDLWKSKEGLKWELVKANTPYDAYAGIAAFKGALYAAKTTVWKSQNGKDWVQINSSGPIQDKDALPHLLELQGQLFLFDEDRVWLSNDGVKWTRQPNAPYGSRSRYAITVYKNAIYVMGGAKQDKSRNYVGAFYPDWVSYNDVWKTKDGRRWERVASRTPWTNRMWPSAVAHKGKLVLVGGFDNINKVNLGDTWISDDGEKWCRLNSTQLKGRHWPSLFSRGDDVILAAGNAWPVQNDVWKLFLP